MQKKPVLVLGLGQSGKATAAYLLSSGWSVVAVDAHWDQGEIRAWEQQLGSKELKIDSDQKEQQIKTFAFVVVSPGISQKHPLYAAALSHNIPIFSEAQLILPKITQPCIGITGTNGKTTLTLFLEHLLQVAGIPAKAIGNVGYPFTQYMLECKNPSVCVCELSSYHLETLSDEVLDVGILLEITPDHLDRYGSFEEYAAAKLQMTQCIKKEGIFFVHPTVFQRFPKELERCRGQVVMIPELFSFPSKDSYLQLRAKKEYCDFLEILREKVLSLELLYLAKAVAEKFFIAEETLKKAMKTFVKPPHRLESVALIRGVRFINDSKATNIESVIHAINTVPGSLLLIAGGKDKNLRFEQWKKPFASRVRKIFVIGESSRKIQQAMEGEYEVELCKDLEEATRKAFAAAKEKESVLLSPGCASFDQYKNYMHRGECFREIVTVLKGEFSQ